MDIIKRDSGLDLLKFISIILISFHHYTGTFPLDSSILNVIFSNCYVFVELMFIISGFLISSKESEIQSSPFWSFLKKRSFRLYPAYWVSLGIYLSINVFEELTDKILLTGIPLTSFGLIQSFLLLPSGLLNIFNFINPTAWFICALLVCNCVLWFILHISKKIKTHPVFLYSIISIIGVESYMKCGLFSGVANGSDVIGRAFFSFFLGCILHHVSAAFQGKKAVITAFVILITAFIAICYYRQINNDTYLIIVILLFPSIILIEQNLKFKFISSNVLFSFLGKASFSIYLFDFITLWIIKILVSKSVLDDSAAGINMLIRTIAIIVTGILFYLFVEAKITKVATCRYKKVI